MQIELLHMYVADLESEVVRKSFRCCDDMQQSLCYLLIEFLQHVSAVVQMPEILGRCESVIASTALQNKSGLERALSLTRGHRDSGAARLNPASPL